MGRRPGPVEDFRPFAIELEVAATRRRAIDSRWDTLALRNADANAPRRKLPARDDGEGIAAKVEGKSRTVKLFYLGAAVFSGNDSVFDVRPIEDFLEMLGLNAAKLKPMVKDSGRHRCRRRR